MLCGPQGLGGNGFSRGQGEGNKNEVGEEREKTTKRKGRTQDSGALNVSLSGFPHCRQVGTYELVSLLEAPLLNPVLIP